MDKDRKANIKVEIDPACTEPVVVIRTDRQSALVEKMVYAVEQCVLEEYPQITVFDEGTVVLINQWDVVRVYTENRKLTVCTVSGKYESRMSLTDLEGILQADTFTRISRFEIINLRRVKGFDMNVAGTIRVLFEDGSETWVARRYVRSIQEKLYSLGLRR